jgi:lipopolysaccharide biosynthesis regulator YciM
MNEAERVTYWLSEADRLLDPVIDAVKKYDDDDIHRHDVLGKLAKIRGAIELAQRAHKELWLQ